MSKLNELKKLTEIDYLDNEKYIEAVAKEADKSFWEVVFREFPEIKTHELDSSTILSRLDNNIEDIKDWIRKNRPRKEDKKL